MKFITPPKCQGQIVEVSYAAWGDQMVRRIHDQSDRTTSYHVAPIKSRDWKWYETWCGQTEPSIPDSRWKKVTESQVSRMEENGP